MKIRLLGPGDEAVLSALARDEAAFDVAGRGRSRPALGNAAATAYLADPDVLHWVAEEGGAVVGHLLCYVQRRRVGDSTQLMLYEMGVRDDRRRRGVGTALVGEMERWMRAAGVAGVWVLADNEGAEAFYEACGFSRDDLQPVQMSRRV
jgi:predicted N-acetyltransferase YhbS